MSDVPDEEVPTDEDAVPLVDNGEEDDDGDLGDDDEEVEDDDEDSG